MWVKLTKAAERFDVSKRTLRRWIEEDGFPCSQAPSGTLLINVKKADKWLAKRDLRKNRERLVDEILA